MYDEMAGRVEAADNGSIEGSMISFVAEAELIISPAVGGIRPDIY